jgi:hypothetical protein
MSIDRRASVKRRTLAVLLALAAIVCLGMVWAFPRSYSRALPMGTGSRGISRMMQLAIDEMGSRVSWGRHVDVELTGTDRGGIRFAFLDAREPDDPDTERGQPAGDAVVEFRDNVMVCTDNVPFRRVIAFVKRTREHSARLQRFASGACAVLFARAAVPSAYRFSVDDDANGAEVTVYELPAIPDSQDYVRLDSRYRVVNVRHALEPVTP